MAAQAPLAAVIVHFNANGEIIWVEYPETGETLSQPKADLGAGQSINFEQWNLKELLAIHEFSLLTIRKVDGGIMRCVHQWGCKWW